MYQPNQIPFLRCNNRLEMNNILTLKSIVGQTGDSLSSLILSMQKDLFEKTDDSFSTLLILTFSSYYGYNSRVPDTSEVVLKVKVRMARPAEIKHVIWLGNHDLSHLFRLKLERLVPLPFSSREILPPTAQGW